MSQTIADFIVNVAAHFVRERYFFFILSNWLVHEIDHAARSVNIESLESVVNLTRRPSSPPWRRDSDPPAWARRRLEHVGEER